MKTLYLDIGNTYLKVAGSTGNGWIIHFQDSILSPEKLYRFLDETGEFELITSSVRGEIIKAIEKKYAGGKVISVTSEMIPREWLDYETPESLGVDRFLACLGAFKKSEKNIIVVDAGTACTIDLMTADHIYRGGVIMPGLKVFHRAMTQNLPELPAVSRDLPDDWPGKSTRKSMQWGVNGSFYYAAETFINKYIEQYDDPDIYVTGGDAELLVHFLGGKYQLNHLPHLLFDGIAAFRKELQLR